jgi:hypothetical protein
MESGTHYSDELMDIIEAATATSQRWELNCAMFY